MTAPDRDPLTIAREVFRETEGRDRDELVPCERDRLDLARAVIAVSDLADRMDESVKKPGGIGIYTAARTMYARNIRYALNGDNA